MTGEIIRNQNPQLHAQDCKQKSGFLRFGRKFIGLK